MSDVREDLDQSIDSATEEYEEVFHKNYGNTIPIGIDEDGRERYLLGPHYYIFLLAWLISLVLIAFILKTLYPVSYKVPFGGSLISCAVYAFLYLKIGFSRPGIASSPRTPNDVRGEDMDRYCVPCKIVKDRSTKHCFYCDVCIYGYDHHCPWVGKCIGRDNLSLFYSFLMSLSAMFGFLIWASSTAKSAPSL